MPGFEGTTSPPSPASCSAQRGRARKRAAATRCSRSTESSAARAFRFCFRARLLLVLGRAENALEILEGDTSGAAASPLGRLLLAESLYRARSYDDSARTFRDAIFGQTTSLSCSRAANAGQRREAGAPAARLAEACRPRPLTWAGPSLPPCLRHRDGGAEDAPGSAP